MVVVRWLWWWWWGGGAGGGGGGGRVVVRWYGGGGGGDCLNYRNSVRRLSSVRRWLNSTVYSPTKMKFECSICNHSFSRRDTMQRHSRNVHGHGTDSDPSPNIHTKMTFQHPFSMIITGPSASGETEWTRKLLL